jgi:hypothetical protein
MFMLVVCIIIVFILWYIVQENPEKPFRVKSSISVQTVVARYSEDISWTKYMPNVIIYNKGVALPNTIPLENRGREGHTYYHHIVTNYDSLPNWTIFLQGNPFDHSPHLYTNVSTFLKNNLSNRFFSLSEKICTDDIRDGRTWHNNVHSWYYNLPEIPKKLPMDVYVRIFGKKPNIPIVSYGTGAQFIVSREAILSRPKSFYEKIVAMLDKENNPVEGFIMERFHNLVFS